MSRSTIEPTVLSSTEAAERTDRLVRETRRAHADRVKALAAQQRKQLDAFDGDTLKQLVALLSAHNLKAYGIMDAAAKTIREIRSSAVDVTKGLARLHGDDSTVIGASGSPIEVARRKIGETEESRDEDIDQLRRDYCDEQEKLLADRTKQRLALHKTFDEEILLLEEGLDKALRKLVGSTDTESTGEILRSVAKHRDDDFSRVFTLSASAEPMELTGTSKRGRRKVAIGGVVAAALTGGVIFLHAPAMHFYHSLRSSSGTTSAHNATLPPAVVAFRETVNSMCAKNKAAISYQNSAFVCTPTGTDTAVALAIVNSGANMKYVSGDKNRSGAIPLTEAVAERMGTQSGTFIVTPTSDPTTRLEAALYYLDWMEAIAPSSVSPDQMPAALQQHLFQGATADTQQDVTALVKAHLNPNDPAVQKILQSSTISQLLSAAASNA